MYFCTLQVRRGQHLVHDTLLQLQNAGAAIRRPLKVHFIGEEGVDEGGVQKVPARMCCSLLSPCPPCPSTVSPCSHLPVPNTPSVCFV